MANIIEFPDLKKLKEEIVGLKAKLSEKFFERDELKLVECENIKMEYMLIFGKYEIELYETYIDYLRCKREIELLQAKINREEEIDYSAIQDILDAELSEYQIKFNNKIDEMNEALYRNNQKTMSEEDSKEFKKLYKEIVKALHPDLNPELTEEQKEMFIIAVDSYKNGNLENLRIIYAILENDEGNLPETNKISELNKEKEKLENLIKKVEKEIETIKNTYPYNHKIYLEDENLKEEKIKELLYQTDVYAKQVKKLNREIQEMYRGRV